jgi:hypothetical protein
MSWELLFHILLSIHAVAFFSLLSCCNGLQNNEVIKIRYFLFFSRKYHVPLWMIIGLFSLLSHICSKLHRTADMKLQILNMVCF